MTLFSEEVRLTSIVRIDGPDGKLVVDVRYDGVVVYGTDYEPSDAARLFWDALMTAHPHLSDPANLALRAQVLQLEAQVAERDSQIRALLDEQSRLSNPST